MYNDSNFILNMEILVMTDDEIRLINLIRNHSHPEEAILIAIEIICKHLEQFELHQ